MYQVYNIPLRARGTAMQIYNATRERGVQRAVPRLSASSDGGVESAPGQQMLARQSTAALFVALSVLKLLLIPG